MSNIELFDEYTARILAMLYESFPIRRPLDAVELSGTQIDDYGVPVDVRGKRSRAFEVCFATIQWLIDSGYIVSQGDNGYCFAGCVLTARGLEILKSTPDSLQRKESVGERIVQLIRNGSLDVARDAASAAISAGIGMLK